MELASSFDQGFPVLRVLTDVVLSKFHADLLELGIEAHHKLLELRLAGYLISDRH